ncbi:MAG: N-acetylmuramoyl-L-alanine amidase [Neptuniibacter pectenicola]|jgi:N-acetylmuramoyl-L-alanine amidase|nr:MAG: hypothetical protein AXW15_10770 [Neptuniibacter sp. Phe_28]
MKTCALVIGHKKNSPGAVNEHRNLSEFTFNEALAKEIESAVVGVHIQRVYRRTYSALPSDLNELEPDFILSLHCNAFNKTASGTEVLYYHRSALGRQMADILQVHLVHALGLPNRGIKPKNSEDRGGYLLQKTNAPCLIAEPFFIDNDHDLEIAFTSYAALIEAYARAIEQMAELVD